MHRIATRLLRPATTSIVTSRALRLNLQRRNMSEMKKVFTENACPPAGPYSQAIIAGPQIFVSGQIPADTKGNLIEGSIADKTKQCCENIVGILTEVGVAMERVVKVNVFLDDMAHFAEMNGVFEKYFAHKPARSCVAVKQLPKGVPVEIECIAYTG
ncbi:Endoribonuclease L-PSP/chorismate mutase-like protein [Ampelomyces quisqualis]|uniref:Endoribonuclease L-PSP/chorismate mutase-like protein n=1 Tax=Ampelomyces quisqualis TaxID=50730 RepID=A0A6A5QPJ8_AMPQU|nr:Endoribonuclease L-PSP/chorismate mutase-like protein [Ampelomyces quisqualis]